MRQNSKPLSPPAKDFRRMTLTSGDSSHFSIVKTKRARRRRLKLGSLKYTCQASTKIDDPLKITVSLSSSPPPSSSGKDGVVLSSETREGEYGVVSVIGRRSEMEDAVRAEVGFAVKGGKRVDFFGVYDGHGGAHVAGTCRERMHEVVARELEGLYENDGSGDNGLEWERVMEGCFGKMDEEVRGNAAARTVGTTAVVAVVAEEEVVVANCGDCRAVMSRAGGAFALSTDHKPDRPDELKRIEDAGGRVINWNGYRVLGVLATSRSIGDQYLRPFVISKPEVTVTKRTDKDEFLILASDGLWDVLSNEVACKVVKNCLDGQVRRFSKEDVSGSRASAAATALAELAMARGSRDNISVIVVDLTKT
ncbi:Protein phosphatase 2C [Trema orientale]|uniref:protein-serine/threonine phosphatase n=1 Tax=Trema orientale TaxID=63057 RepID=A0A2P5FGC2_TREOI|nr:Protein phosphatase 2C [Trema orientale]